MLYLGPGSNAPESECAIPDPATAPCHPSPSLLHAENKPKTPTKMRAAWRANEVVGRRLHNTHFQTHLNQLSFKTPSPPKSQCPQNSHGLVELSPGISDCHHRDIQGLSLQHVFNQPKNKDANPPSPLTLCIKQAHFQPPQVTNCAFSNPHSRGQVLCNTPLPPLQPLPGQVSRDTATPKLRFVCQ